MWGECPSVDGRWAFYSHEPEGRECKYYARPWWAGVLQGQWRWHDSMNLDVRDSNGHLAKTGQRTRIGDRL